MEKMESTREIEQEIIEDISEISNHSGISFEIVLDIILDAFFDWRSGRPEEDCRQIMSEKIDRYRKEY